MNPTQHHSKTWPEALRIQHPFLLSSTSIVYRRLHTPSFSRTLNNCRLKWVVLARQSKLSGGLLQRKSYPSMGTKRLSVYPTRSCLLKRSAQHNVFNQPRKLSWRTWRGYASRGMVCSGGNPPSNNFHIEVISLIDFSIFFPGRTAKVKLSLVVEDLFRSTS